MKVIIDRIEGCYAVAELDKGKWANIPLCLVPGIREGDIVNIEILKDETKQKHNESEKKLNSLFE